MLANIRTHLKSKKKKTTQKQKTAANTQGKNEGKLEWGRERKVSPSPGIIQP
jgi:hypothetical protein